MTRWIVATVDRFLGEEDTKQAAVENHHLTAMKPKRRAPGYYEYTDRLADGYRDRRRTVFVMTRGVAEREGFQTEPASSRWGRLVASIKGA